jgi:hypothetical protein
VGHGVRLGYSGAGPRLLYQALVHAMDGSVAPATDGRFIDEPSSFYGWLTRQQEAVHSSAAYRSFEDAAFANRQREMRTCSTSALLSVAP